MTDDARIADIEAARTSGWPLGVRSIGSSEMPPSRLANLERTNSGGWRLRKADVGDLIAAYREALTEAKRLRAERAESEARVREALISLATVTDDEYATVVARHVESLLTLDLQTSDGEVQPEACPTVSGASPSEPDDPHGACSRNLVAMAVERDKALARASRAADVRERIAQAIDQAWAEASDNQARRPQPRTAYSVAYGEGYLDGLENAEGIARSTPLSDAAP